MIDLTATIPPVLPEEPLVMEKGKVNQRLEALSRDVTSHKKHMCDDQRERYNVHLGMANLWILNRERSIALYINSDRRRRYRLLEEEKNHLPPVVLMARSYSPFGASPEENGERYHLQLNHIGSKVIANTLKPAYIPFKPRNSLCDVCALNKIKAHAHKTGTFSRENYGPGQLIVCDTIGPLLRSLGG